MTRTVTIDSHAYSAWTASSPGRDIPLSTRKFVFLVFFVFQTKKCRQQQEKSGTHPKVISEHKLFNVFPKVPFGIETVTGYAQNTRPATAIVCPVVV
jgi:hypothetical protein